MIKVEAINAEGHTIDICPSMMFSDLPEDVESHTSTNGPVMRADK